MCWRGRLRPPVGVQVKCHACGVVVPSPSPAAEAAETDTRTIFSYFRFSGCPLSPRPLLRCYLWSSCVLGFGVWVVVLASFRRKKNFRTKSQQLLFWKRGGHAELLWPLLSLLHNVSRRQTGRLTSPAGRRVEPSRRDSRLSVLVSEVGRGLALL